MAKLVVVFEDDKENDDYKFGVQFLDQSKEEENSAELTKAGMAAFLTGYIIQQGYLNDYKDEFMKFTRDATNEIALKKLEEERAQKRIDNGVERKDDKKD